MCIGARLWFWIAHGRGGSKSVETERCDRWPHGTVWRARPPEYYRRRSVKAREWCWCWCTRLQQLEPRAALLAAVVGRSEQSTQVEVCKFVWLSLYCKADNSDASSHIYIATRVSQFKCKPSSCAAPRCSRALACSRANESRSRIGRPWRGDRLAPQASSCAS